MSAGTHQQDWWIQSRHQAMLASDSSPAALPGPVGQLPGDQLYLDLAQYEQLIEIGTADADARGRPVDDVTARRLAIWLAARPQHPVFAQGLAASPAPARSAPS